MDGLVRARWILGAVLLGASAAQATGLRSPAIDPEALSERLGDADPPLVIDVRAPDQYSAGHIPSAVNVPVPRITAYKEEIEEAAQAVLYCNDMRFTAVAEQMLRRSGVKAFFHLEGGLKAWTDRGLTVESSLPE
jgi:rhodanese-related sulfurtransferase